MSDLIQVGQENSSSIEHYYEHYGSAPPVMLIQGLPLKGDASGKQNAALSAAGHRAITYDRRGFGRSSKPCIGYNYDTLAASPDTLPIALDLLPPPCSDRSFRIICQGPTQRSPPAS
jgi:pimeloyl-ACP methyl ester carboxylesterase